MAHNGHWDRRLKFSPPPIYLKLTAHKISRGGFKSLGGISPLKYGKLPSRSEITKKVSSRFPELRRRDPVLSLYGRNTQ